MRNDPSENTVKSIINWDSVFNSVKDTPKKQRKHFTFSCLDISWIGQGKYR